MKLTLSTCFIVFLLGISPQVHAQDTAPKICSPNIIRANSILSDTHGIDFKEYLKEVLKKVRSKWIPIIPSEARSPVDKRGCVTIEFFVQKNGKIHNLEIVESSGDKLLDDAAWKGILACHHFQHLPKQYPEKNLKLRFHFYYNVAKTTNALKS